MTRRQMAANRQNALKSTGPVSLEGRSIARGNALKHGLCATAIIYPDEDGEEFLSLQARMIDKYHPEGPDEEFLVQRITICMWQIERSCRLEVETVVAAMGLALYNLRSYREHPQAPEILKQACDGVSSAAAFIEIAHAQKVPAFDLVLRYRSDAERGFYRALNQLLKLQALRKGAEALVIKGSK